MEAAVPDVSGGGKTIVGLQELPPFLTPGPQRWAEAEGGGVGVVLA